MESPTFSCFIGETGVILVFKLIDLNTKSLCYKQMDIVIFGCFKFV